MSDALESRVVKTEPINWRDLQFLQQDDFKEWFGDGDRKLQQSLLRYQFIDPFKVWEHDGVLYCLDGKHRYRDLVKVAESGIEVPDLLPATFIDCANRKEAAELVLVYSSAYARITEQGLAGFVEDFHIDLGDVSTSINLPEFDLGSMLMPVDNSAESQRDIAARTLRERFLVPPFSILDTRQGYWQERKRAWHALGINSQETREDVELVARSGQAPAVYALRNEMRAAMSREPTWDEIIAEARRRKMHIYEGASIFDPVLCEVLYTWFCPERAVILDPFAGGSVRGIVAAKLGHYYHGIDLRAEQVEANRRQAEELQASECEWYAGDSLDMDTMLPAGMEADFIFSCPPYHDLEKYSDDPADLSNMSYPEFVVKYQLIIAKAVQRLKPNRFACFVVGDIRDEKGFYRNFISDTIDAFQHSGECRLYNEIILVNVAGSMPVRVGRQFTSGRKVGKMHQNVLVFYKGDPKLIKSQYPELDLSALHNPEAQPNIALSQKQGNEQLTTAIHELPEGI